MKTTRKALILASLVLVLPLLVPLTALATSFTWTGAADTTWTQATSPFNWSGGSGLNVYPGSVNVYGDTATISISTNNPVTLSSTVTLNGATALTIGTGAGATALDIASGGTLGVQGNISNRKVITIEGTLSNDTSPAATNTVSGSGSSLFLKGGTISSLHGGAWSVTGTNAIVGYGTISAPFSLITSGNVSANTANQTLHITGDVTDSVQRGLGGNSTTAASGALLSIEGGTITGGGVGGISNYNNVAMRGHFDGITLYQDSTLKTFTLTGDSTWNNGALNTMYFNGYKLDVTGSVGNFGANSGGVNVGTGTLNNPGGTLTTISNGNTITLAGGSITSTGVGGFSMATNIRGFGTVSTPMTITANGGMSASGGTLAVTGPVTVAQGSGVGTLGASGDVLDLSSTFTSYGSTLGSGTSGVVNFNGANVISTSTYVSSGITFSTGAINVTNSSTLTGLFNSSATLGINATKTLDISAATVNVAAGAMTNSGTLAVGGTGVLNNSVAGAYSLSGGGNITLAGGSVTSTGGGGFTSDNTLRGYGTVSALYTNNGKVIADGGGVEQTLNMQAITAVTDTAVQGWFAQNHGKLLLPSLAVNSATTYNWGGIQMVNSVAMTFGGAVIADALTIALLSPDRVDVPTGLVKPIGVWAYTPGNSLTFGSVGMTFCYDNTLATTLGLSPGNFGLFGYDGTQWLLIPTNPADTVNDLLTTTSTLPSFYQDFAIAQAPEPASLSLVIIGALGLLLRNRRMFR